MYDNHRKKYKLIQTGEPVQSITPAEAEAAYAEHRKRTLFGDTGLSQYLDGLNDEALDLDPYRRRDPFLSDRWPVDNG